MNQVVVRNIEYVKREGSPLLQVSLFTRFFCGFTIVGYICACLFDSTVDVVAVTPGSLLPPNFSIWTLATFFLIECHFWEVIVDCVTLGLCGKLIEPLWGSIEMICFFLVCNLGAVFASTAYYLLVYMCTRNSEYLFDIRIYGQSAYVAGVSVAVQQIMPDHPLVHTKLGTFSNRNVPIAVLRVSIILWLLGLLEGMYPVMFCNGILISWIYLRFFQHHSNRRGDHSESFRFERLFPNVLQRPLKVFLNLLYIIGLKLNIRSACRDEPLLPVTRNTPAADQLSELDCVDVERRRQIALKALNERLSSQKKSMKLPAKATNATTSEHPKNTYPMAPVTSATPFNVDGGGHSSAAMPATSISGDTLAANPPPHGI